MLYGAEDTGTFGVSPFLLRTMFKWLRRREVPLQISLSQSCHVEGRLTLPALLPWKQIHHAFRKVRTRF